MLRNLSLQIISCWTPPRGSTWTAPDAGVPPRQPTLPQPTHHWDIPDPHGWRCHRDLPHPTALGASLKATHPEMSPAEVNRKDLPSGIKLWQRGKKQPAVLEDSLLLYSVCSSRLRQGPCLNNANAACSGLAQAYPLQMLSPALGVAVAVRQVTAKGTSHCVPFQTAIRPGVC